MTDTSASTEAYLEAQYRELTPGQRIEMACGMWTAAVTMARAGIRHARPGLSESEERVQLLERFYAGDLAPDMMTALVARFRSA